LTSAVELVHGTIIATGLLSLLVPLLALDEGELDIGLGPVPVLGISVVGALEAFQGLPENLLVLFVHANAGSRAVVKGGL
jgi:hypothetical protein